MVSIVKAHQGKDIILQCNAKGVPTPSISWVKDNSLIPDIHSKLLQKSSLFLSNLNQDDSGIYSCIASNEAGFDSRDVELQVGGRYNIIFHYLTLICIVVF